MSLIRLSEWLTRLNVKDTFVDDPADEDVLVSAKAVVRGLERIEETFEKVIDDNRLDFEIVLGNFRFIVEGIEKNYDFREFDGLNTWDSWTDAFNEYMSMLYGMADSRVDVEGLKGYKNGNYKFIWVN